MKRLEATLELSKLLSVTYNNVDELQQIVQDDSSWEDIIKVANRYILVPALYASLKRKNLLILIKDEQLIEYMKEIYTLNTQRNKAILKQLHELCALLSKIEVKPILLKGSAALSEAHYDTIGERAMMDIDILVPEDKVFECVNFLKQNDEYKEIEEGAELSPRWHHYNRLYKDKGMTSVEIHRYPLHAQEIKYFPKELGKDFIQQSKSIDNASVIQPLYELYHSFLHSQISHDYHKSKFLALRHLHHFTIMATQYKTIEWNELSQLIKEKNLSKIWEEYLFIIQTIFKIQMPIQIKKSKSKAKYLQQVYKRVDMTGSKQLLLKVFINRVLSAFSYEKLCYRYNFTNKFLLFIYIPRRIIHLLYIYITKPKKIRFLINIVRMTSN